MRKKSSKSESFIGKKPENNKHLGKNLQDEIMK